MALEEWNYNPEGFDVQNLGDDDYTELRSSGKEQYTEDGSTANRVFELNWDVRAAFIDDCLGYSYLSGTTIIRVLPDEHPEIANFFALDASVEGKGVLGQSDNGSISWTHAVVTVNYRPREYLVSANEDFGGNEQNRYTSRASEFAGELLTTQTGMKFVTAPQRLLTSSPGRLTATQELTYTWYDVPALAALPFIVPNSDARDACIGKLNSEIFDQPGVAYPVGTILFLGQTQKFKTPKLGESVGGDGNGSYRWDISMKFLYRNNGVWAGTTGAGPTDDDYIMGHNFVFDAAAGKYDLITHDGTAGGKHLYPDSADLNTLWTVNS